MCLDLGSLFGIRVCIGCGCDVVGIDVWIRNWYWDYLWVKDWGLDFGIDIGIW